MMSEEFTHGEDFLSQESDNTEIYYVSDPEDQISGESSMSKPIEERELTGLWGPIRLFREASLDNIIECIEWCTSLRIISPTAGLNQIIRRQAYVQQQHLQSVHESLSCSISNISFPFSSQLLDGQISSSKSIFDETDIPLEKAVMLLLCFAHGSSGEASRRTCIYQANDSVPSSTTILNFFRTIRFRLSAAYTNSTPMIGGEGITVAFGARYIYWKNNSESASQNMYESALILAAIDTNDNLRLQSCPIDDLKEMLKIINENVSVASKKVYTNDWLGWSKLKELNYKHHICSFESQSPRGEHDYGSKIISKVEAELNFAKKRMITDASTRGLKFEELDESLVEICWRRKMKKKACDPFIDLVRQMRMT